MAEASIRSARDNPGEASARASDLWHRGDHQACLLVLKGLADQGTEVKNNLFAVEAILTDWIAEKPEDRAKLQEGLQSLSTREEFQNLPASKTLPPSAVLLVNTATVLAHCGQHEASLKLLEPLWHALQSGSLRIEANEELLLGACFALIEVDFALQRTPQVAGILAWLAKHYDLGGEEEGDGESRAGNAADASTSSVHSGDLASLASPSSPKATDQVPRTVCGYDLSCLVLCWRARLHLRTANLRAAKSSIRSLLALYPRHNQSICLKAELEALRGNLRRAGKLVAGGLPDEGARLHGPKAVQALCNMGCIQHYEGKHHSALFCYSKALDAAGGLRNELRPADGKPEAKAAGVEQTLGVKAALLFNAALQALRAGRWDTALETFQLCAVAEPWDPLIRLRMAECCVGASVDNTPLSRQGTSSPADEGSSEAKHMTTTETLQQGIQYATDAIPLFEKQMLANQQASELERAETSERGGGLSEDIGRSQQQAGKLAALACAAYLNLRLSRRDDALQLARQIVQAAKVGSSEWQLGQTYTSEALNLLNKAPEAVLHLHAALNGLLNAEVPIDKEEVGNGTSGEDSKTSTQDPSSSPPASGPSAKVPLLVNLASTYFSAGDLSQAHEFAVAATDSGGQRDAVMTRAYIDLCTGNMAAALSHLRAFQLGVDPRPRAVQ